MFSSLTNALKYLRDALKDWSRVKITLEERLRQIARMYQQARKRNDQEQMGKMIILQQQTQDNLIEYEKFAQKLGPFRSYFESNTLGVFPVFIVTGAVGLASAVYIYLEKVKNEGKALELIEKGMLKPDEARSLLTGGGISETLGNVNTMLMLGLGVYALFLFGPMLKKG